MRRITWMRECSVGFALLTLFYLRSLLPQHVAPCDEHAFRHFATDDKNQSEGQAHNSAGNHKTLFLFPIFIREDAAPKDKNAGFFQLEMQ